MSGLLAPVEILHPPRLAFGPGRAAEVGAWAAARGLSRFLVLAGRSNAGRVGLLGLAGEVAVFGSVKPEPDIANLEAALELAEAARPDCVIGFGGGSALDLAKLVAALSGSGQRLQEVVGAEKLRGRRAALVQVPTTAGTGSEAGTRALVTDPATRQKLAVQSRHMLADLAVVDPDLMLGVPPAITAATGLDALAHCIEAFTSKRAHPLLDPCLLEGIRLVGRHLPRAVAEGRDREARAGLALAALYGGYGLGPVNTTAGHALAYPLGTRHGLAHGLACALMLPHALAFNAPAVPEKTRAVLEALGTEDAARWCAALGIPMRLSAHGIPADDLPAMAKEAHAIRRLLDNNPRDISEAEILELYRRAY